MTDTQAPPGRHLLFDIETNGLMPMMDVVHCMTMTDVVTEEVFTFVGSDIPAGLDMMYLAATLIGHNIINFDFKALRKVYNWNPRPGTRIIDTLVVSRVMHSALKMDDAKAARPDFTNNGKSLVGSHSLKAWGIRLGEHKADYDGGWAECSPEMVSYMEQDVKTNLRLLRHLKPGEYPQAPLELEYRVEAIVGLIEEAGWPFDTKAAGELYAILVGRRDILEKSLAAKFGSWQELDKQFIAKVNNKARGITKGDLVSNWKTVEFNPGSRVHIEKVLREAGWEPEVFTPTGRAKLDDTILEDLDVPGAEEVVEYLLVQKRLGQIADGDNGWLRMVGSDGCIHARYNPMGTRHSRASHYGPNIGQVPNAYALYGPECRALFTVRRGWKLVGADMAGAQLRCLGHFIAAFDGGAYGKIVTEGDIHTYHMEAAAPYIKTRDNSKTTIYAKLFGGQKGRIGKINGASSAIGQKILDLLSTKIPGLGKLEKAVKAACSKKWLKGLDGRRVPVASDRLGLNYLVTSTEAILCKAWMCNWFDMMQASGYTHGWSGDFVLVGWIHDELQVAVREGLEEVVGEMLVDCARRAGDAYGLRVKLDSSYKVGDNWKDTH